MAKKDDYMSQAYKRAGSFNRTSYANERKSAKNKYNTSLSSLKNEYNNFINEINSQRAKNTNSFNTGRNTIERNAYFANRQNAQDLAARGLSGGIAKLNQMTINNEIDRQHSDLANNYYNTVEELDTSQRQADDQYKLDKRGLKDDYESLIANINAREASDYMNYKLRVASLAESIQNRLYQEQKDIKNEKAAYVQGLVKNIDMTDPNNVYKVADFIVSEGRAKNREEAFRLLYDNYGFNPNSLQNQTLGPSKFQQFIYRLGPNIIQNEINRFKNFRERLRGE